MTQNKLYKGFFSNAGGMVHPTSKIDLMNEIEKRLDRGQYNLNDIDTSKITDMSLLFSSFLTRDLYNIDMSRWDVSRVTNMSGMFYFCTKFNSDLSSWDVSNVEDMNNMFFNCENFNSDLSRWDVSKVKNMSLMFSDCINFNSDLSRWDVSKVTNMFSMFYNCKKFNCDLSGWDVRNDVFVNLMFAGCDKFDKSYLSKWDIHRKSIATAK